MKNIKRWKELRLVLGICAALGWWGALFPEFTLSPDTCRVIRCEPLAGTERELTLEELEQLEETGVAEMEDVDWKTVDYNTLYRDILSADPDRIVYKSRLWEELHRLFENK